MATSATFWNSRDSARPGGTRSSSVPPIEPTANLEAASDMKNLADLTRTNPAAAAAVRALIKADHTIGAALAMMQTAMATAAPPKAQDRPSTPKRDHARRPGCSNSAPLSPSPLPNRKRVAPHENDAPRKKPTKGARATTPIIVGSEEEDDGLDIDYGARNHNSFEEHWPSNKICRLVKSLDFVDMWFFTPAGCRAAAKDRRDGTEQAMLLQADGTLKPAGPPQSLVKDWDLDAHDFRSAADKWLKVAMKMGVSTRMQNSIALLNNEICGHESWSTEPTPLIRWHHHQRETWARDRFTPGCYALHALDPATYANIRLRGAVAASDAANTRSAIAEAAVATMRQQQQGSTSSRQANHQPQGDNFRHAGGAGDRTTTQHSSSTPSGSGIACLRCGSSRSHHFPRCNSSTRSDGSSLRVDHDQHKGGLQFIATREPACVQFNTRGCEYRERDCRRQHRCTWCTGRDHGHQQCRQAPHRR
ncbi:unnamed protein product [Tilletia controversa]|nr:unnamed protein product [Tilletia controversa]